MRADIAGLLALHPVFDGHNDVAWALRTQSAYDLDRLDLSAHQPSLQTDIGRLRAGGVGAQFFSVFVPGNLPGGSAMTQTLEQIDCVRRIVERYPETFVLARSAAEVREAMAGSHIAALMGAEGGQSIDSSLGVLRLMRVLGVAYLTLTHNHNTPWADSATDEPQSGGLSDFGREVVAELNRVGMLVDISHVAESTMHDALDASTAPVIFSHSSCRAVCDHPRNPSDAVLSRLAGNGGVQMVTFVPHFVSQKCADHHAAEELERDRLGLRSDSTYGDDPPPEDPAAVAELDAWRAAHPTPDATIADVVAHLDHAREVTGVAHIGLGGDFDGTDKLPVGLTDVSCYPALLAELADRGWSTSDLAGLTSGNILRVLQDAEDAADPDFGR